MSERESELVRDGKTEKGGRGGEKREIDRERERKRETEIKPTTSVSSM